MTRGPWVLGQNLLPEKPYVLLAIGLFLSSCSNQKLKGGATSAGKGESSSSGQSSVNSGTASTQTAGGGSGSDRGIFQEVNVGELAAKKQASTTPTPAAKRLAATKSKVFISGAGEGGGPRVRLFDAATGAQMLDVFSHDPNLRTGIRVATGDVNGDGTPDIIAAPGPGGGPHVRVLNGKNGAELMSFFAYDPNFRGGVYVAAGDVDGDGKADIITGAGEGGAPHVRAFQAMTGNSLASFFAYDSTLRIGARVGAGDVDADGKAEIITGAGEGGGPHVKVFRANGTELASYFAFEPEFRGGVFVSAGDIDGDGKMDVVAGAGKGGGPRVRCFQSNSTTEICNFFAYDASFRGGVRVGSVDVATDGKWEIVTGSGTGGGPHLRIVDRNGADAKPGFFAYDPGFLGGIFVGGN